MMRTSLWALTLLSLLGGALGGCQPMVAKDKFDKLDQQWLDSQQQNRDLTRRTKELEETIGRQNQQITELQNLGPKRLDKLFYVTGLELGRRSGGLDTDGKDGDDGVMVYLQPVDRDGHVIKAAGEATIQLYDLANKPDENMIGEYRWPLDELGKRWAGGFLGSSQFSLMCPWLHGPPAHDQLTIRVTFIDYLTGKTFTAQKVVTVHLPGAAQSAQGAAATQPALAPTSQEAN
jgi:hypothetical protein